MVVFSSRSGQQHMNFYTKILSKLYALKQGQSKVFIPRNGFFSISTQPCVGGPTTLSKQYYARRSGYVYLQAFTTF